MSRFGAAGEPSGYRADGCDDHWISDYGVLVDRDEPSTVEKIPAGSLCRSAEAGFDRKFSSHWAHFKKCSERKAGVPVFTGFFLLYRWSVYYY